MNNYDVKPEGNRAVDTANALRKCYSKMLSTSFEIFDFLAVILCKNNKNGTHGICEILGIFKKCKNKNADRSTFIAP